MHCPVCKADNAAGPHCRRCRADLSLLFTVEKQQRQRLAEVADLARQRQWHAALQAAEAADQLRRDEHSLHRLLVCRLMLRDFARAWPVYGALARRFRFAQGKDEIDHE
jgi:methylphosphotriester-DNA--protein-cysteine methyltransferase